MGGPRGGRGAEGPKEAEVAEGAEGEGRIASLLLDGGLALLDIPLDPVLLRPPVFCHLLLPDPHPSLLLLLLLRLLHLILHPPFNSQNIGLQKLRLLLTVTREP